MWYNYKNIFCHPRKPPPKKPELILPLGGFTPGRCLSSCCSPSLHPPIQSPERREGAQQPLPQEHLGRQPGQPDHAPPQRQPHPPARAVGHRPAHGHRPLRRRPGESHRHGEERAPGGCSFPSAFTSSILLVGHSVKLDLLYEALFIQKMQYKVDKN